MTAKSLINITQFLALGLLTSTSSSVWSQEQSVLRQSITVAGYYADGDYGETTDTTILYFPVSYRANYGKWGFELLVPHLQVEGLGNVLLNVGGVTRAVAGTQVTTSRGMGDSIVSVTYQVDPLSATAPFIDLRLDIKIPTADEDKSLGTGETDYSVQIDLSQNLGNAGVFASLGYNFRGKSNLFEGLEDSAFAQLGFVYPLSDKINAGVFYDFREPASSFSGETHEIVPYFTWQISENWIFTGVSSWGFTDASADVTVLGQLSYSW